MKWIPFKVFTRSNRSRKAHRTCMGKQQCKIDSPGRGVSLLKTYVLTLSALSCNEKPIVGNTWATNNQVKYVTCKVKHAGNQTTVVAFFKMFNVSASLPRAEERG